MVGHALQKDRHAKLGRRGWKDRLAQSETSWGDRQKVPLSLSFLLIFPGLSALCQL